VFSLKYRLSLLKTWSLLRSKQRLMSEQRTITSEAQLREAVRTLWEEDSALNWHWKEWQPHQERGIDAIGELILDKQRVTFAVEFKLNPAARDVELLARKKQRYPLLLIAGRRE
jgi:hypothetical protein